MSRAIGVAIDRLGVDHFHLSEHRSTGRLKTEGARSITGQGQGA